MAEPRKTTKENGRYRVCKASCCKSFLRRAFSSVIDGLVITFSDISIAKRLEAELRRSADT